ncbi:hypothetical protein [Alteribacter aurantiacus]|uniref:hypothetical protein n=1 Tax=Alteribacter aurantiacus TaxID=254410 RepID=UPI000413BD48|nr:hypothetical protein [Alteribacter aurantiacus]
MRGFFQSSIDRWEGINEEQEAANGEDQGANRLRSYVTVHLINEEAPSLAYHFEK